MKRRTTLLMIVVCGLRTALPAQDFKRVMEAMRQQYKESEKLHVVMDIKVYDKETASKPFFDERAVVRRDGQRYAYQYGDMEMVMNEHNAVMIDHGAQQMVYRERGDEAEAMAGYHFDMDSLLSFYDTPKYIGRKEGVDQYRLIQKAGEVKQTDFYVQAESLLLKKLSYTYEQGQLVSIDFVTFDKTPVFTSAVFDTGRFVNTSKGNPALVVPFSHYKLIVANQEELNTK